MLLLQDMILCQQTKIKKKHQQLKLCKRTNKNMNRRNMNERRTDTVHCAQRSGYTVIPVMLSVVTGVKKLANQRFVIADIPIMTYPLLKPPLPNFFIHFVPSKLD